MSNNLNSGYEQRLLGGNVSEDYEENNENNLEKEEKNSDEYYELPPAMRSRTLLWSVISLVLGILSCLLCPFYYVGLALSVMSLVFLLISRKNLGFFDKCAILGLIFGIMGFVCGIFSLCADVLGLFN